MSSGFSQAVAALVVVAGAAGTMDYMFIRAARSDDQRASPAAQRVPVDDILPERGVLRVCADPNNMPFSNERGEGFENELARMIASSLGWSVSYTWWPQRRGFIRNTLAAKKCDVVMGVPARYELAETTQPYYRSTYVTVTRRNDALRIRSFDDPRLKTLTIGLHAIGDDYNNVPPAQMLAMRGIVANIRGYSIYGDYSRPDPPRDLIDAVAKQEVDVAIAWGPLAGYFADRESVKLEVTPLVDDHPSKILPLQFEIAMAVRKGDDELKSRLNTVLSARRKEIGQLLDRYHVPTVDARADRVARTEE